MINTIFLPRGDYELYGDWLNRQDAETLSMYFGIPVTREFIQQLQDRILTNNQDHHFLVAFDHEQWIGVLHLATNQKMEVEFGFIVDSKYRGHGVADRLMDEGVIWARNRGYKRLYLHCLSWNKPIKHLCNKHGLEMHTIDGDSEVEVELPPPSLISIGKEVSSIQRNIWSKMIEKTWCI
jgi:GNAT superfamily N-acetyltransferase